MWCRKAVDNVGVDVSIRLAAVMATSSTTTLSDNHNGDAVEIVVGLL